MASRLIAALIGFAVFNCLFDQILANGGCNMSEIPLDPNFNENLLLGQWIAYRWWHPPHRRDLVLDLHRDENGEVYFDEYMRDDPESPCYYIYSENIFNVGEPGQYNVVSAINPLARVRIMHLSNNYLIFFICDNFVWDECFTPDFEVYYRKEHNKKEEKAVELYTPLLRQACVDPNAMLVIPAVEPCLVDRPGLGSGGKGKGKGGH